MKEKVPIIFSELHKLEDQFIEINGLIKALQYVQPDDYEATCLLNAIDEKLQYLQKEFYGHWESLVNNSL